MGDSLPFTFYLSALVLKCYECIVHKIYLLLSNILLACGLFVWLELCFSILAILRFVNFNFQNSPTSPHTLKLPRLKKKSLLPVFSKNCPLWTIDSLNGCGVHLTTMAFTLPPPYSLYNFGAQLQLYPHQAFGMELQQLVDSFL